ncbi:hypothetical protein [Sphingomonas crocodyli]|uniref:Uncharacterized protein n=1 Tax=Sphingomonas crocodyli TaxID=1979270 RepID=A0A437LXT8_9SPHN|nr:hypothetical protein [Sphingomonas crocodyli]RVT90133.1 hypothetical protein EOD43_17645 [Sphingomonas crocodyli]
MKGDLLADGVGIVAAIGQQGSRLVGDHSEQRPEALHVVGLAGRQDYPERPTFAVAGGVELRSEAVARSAERLGRLRPFFMPTAQ